jgi:hypothetical protein
MSLLPASPTARRREEALFVQARLKALEAGIDRALEMAKEVGSNAPSTPTAEDAFYLAEELASRGTEGLPHGSHVQTEAVDTTTPLQRPYGATYTNLATSISIPIIGTFTPRELLETGLVTKGGKFQAHVYERLLSEVDGVVKGKLIGPRDLMIARQNEARAKHPRLWSNG